MTSQYNDFFSIDQMLSVCTAAQSSHRKLVLSVMLGEDLGVLRAALLTLAFRLSWFPLTAASRRDFK